MNHATLSIAVPAPPEDVHAFLSRIENLPRWAVEFARDFRREGDAARVTTPDGPALVRIESRPGGVVDFLVLLDGTPGELRFPSRVVPLPDGTSAYVFTVFPPPGGGAGDLDDATASLRREMDQLVRCFESPGESA